jgi:hypothetical protein
LAKNTPTAALAGSGVGRLWQRVGRGLFPKTPKHAKTPTDTGKSLGVGSPPLAVKVAPKLTAVTDTKDTN